MLCNACSKLAVIHTTKKCYKCDNTVLLSVASICEICSASDAVCACCLKRVFPENTSPSYKKARGGCKTCGK